MRRVTPLAAAVAFALCAASGVTACKAPVEPPTSAEVLALVNDLLEQGDPDTALALLTEHGLGESPEGQLFAVEAAILKRDFDTAFATLGRQLDLDAEGLVLLEDACAMGALEALYDAEGQTPAPETARARLEHCARSERLDLVALRMRVDGAAPTTEQLDAVLERLRAAEEGPEVDVAAAQLELGLMEHAQAAPEASAEAARLMRLAFSVAQNSELAAQVQQAYFDAGTALAESDPQTAVTLFEHLYLPRVEGLEVDPELSAQAQVAANTALFPIFLSNSRSRYTSKFQDDDVAAGYFDAESSTFTFDVSSDAAYETFIVWYFHRLERPRPTPTPDPLAWAEICADRTQPCSFPYERLARWAYEQRAMEAAYLESHDLEVFEWGQP